MKSVCRPSIRNLEKTNRFLVNLGSDNDRIKRRSVASYVIYGSKIYERTTIFNRYCI